MSSPDDSKEIPARQVADPQQPAPWSIHTDISGEHCVIAGDGQIVAITIPLDGEGNGNDDTRARALCLAKAPEMHRLLTRVTTIVDGDGFDVHEWLGEVEALLKRAE